MSGDVKPGTALPWQYRDDYTTEGFVTIIGNVDGEYVDGKPECTYDVVCRCEDEFGERLPNVATNVRYIVHACNTYPNLLARIEVLETGLRQISTLRPAGDVATVTGTRALVQQMESIALRTLGPRHD